MVKTQNEEGEKAHLLSEKRRSSEQTQQRVSNLEYVESSWTRFLYICCWWWIYPLLSLGYKRQLVEDDLDDPPHRDTTSVLIDRLNSYSWSSTTTWMIVMKEFWRDHFLNALWCLMLLISSVAQPLLIREFCLNVTDEKNYSQTLSYVYVALILTSIAMQVFSQRLIHFQSVRVGLRIRNALMIFIFQRSLCLRLRSWQQIGTGQLMNLMVNDTYAFEELCTYLTFVCYSCIETIIIFGILCWLIHPIPALCAFMILILIILAQLYISRKFSKYNKTTNLSSSQRIQAFSEYIHGLYVVKMYNLQKLLEDRITVIRETELTSIRGISRFRALNISMYFITTSLFSLTTFGSAWLFGYKLTPWNVFPALLFFALLRGNFIGFLPISIEKMVEVVSASNRIDAFVRLTMAHNYGSSSSSSTYDHHHHRRYENQGRIVMTNASFSYNDDMLCLSSLNLTIERGTFVGVAGPVGSGKSSLLAAILGEVDLVHGHLDTHGSTFAYAAQIPWIFINTFRNNILLNRPLDEQRYRDVIHACCLDIDLLSFGPRGDLTIIGEKGVNLSGGQKARVGLARALYSDADIYLLDDPLAAVDRVVAKQIYERCLGTSGLLKDKTRLLVTHQTRFLSKTDQLVFLSHGRIDQDRQEYQNEHGPEEDPTTNTETSPLGHLLEENASLADTTSIISNETPVNDGAQWSIGYHLFTAPPHGIIGFVILIVLFLLTEAAYDSTNYCLRLWLNQSETNEHGSSKLPYIYFSLIVVTVVADVIRANYFYSVFLSGSNNMHSNMLKKLLHTSVQFFESNPSGRILGRVSKDQHIVDESLPTALLDSLIRLFMLAGSITMVLVFNPSVILTLIVVVPVIMGLMYFYQRSSRQLKQLSSITHSPVYALLLTSLNGVSTIRAFRAEKGFIQLISSKMDVNTSACIAVYAAGQWSALRLTLLYSLVVLATSLDIVLFRHQKSVADIALSLMYAMQMAYAFQYGLRMLLETQIMMTHAERIKEYSHLADEEDNGGDQGLLSTSSDWPRDGTIDFRNYSLRHQAHLPYAIRNIDLHIKPGEKVGIIGRTGAGKSTLFKGIVRFIDRSNAEGQILIDGVDISRIALHRLRSHLSVIPQQSILFIGSLRHNLDPMNRYSDEECWKALEQVHLKQFVVTHSAGLLMEIADSGSNLSVGQCQLINIARAILKKSKILLIDEATANVDQMTDDLIQKALYENFQDRTVLIIAHRLNTVARCDRILVFDQGVIVNDDSSANILSSS